MIHTERIEAAAAEIWEEFADRFDNRRLFLEIAICLLKSHFPAPTLDSSCNNTVTDMKIKNTALKARIAELEGALKEIQKFTEETTVISGALVNGITSAALKQKGDA